MQVFKDVEELTLYLGEIGAAGLKLLVDGIGNTDGFGAIAALGLVLPESGEGDQNVIAVLGGRSVDAEGGQRSL